MTQMGKLIAVKFTTNIHTMIANEPATRQTGWLSICGILADIIAHFTTTNIFNHCTSQANELEINVMLTTLTDLIHELAVDFGAQKTHWSLCLEGDL